MNFRRTYATFIAHISIESFTSACNCFRVVGHNRRGGEGLNYIISVNDIIESFMIIKDEWQRMQSVVHVSSNKVLLNEHESIESRRMLCDKFW